MEGVSDDRAKRAVSLFSDANLVIFVGLLILLSLLIFGKSLHLSSSFVTIVFNAVFLTGASLFASATAVFLLESFLCAQHLVHTTVLRLAGWIALALGGLFVIAIWDVISLLSKGFRYI